MMGKCNIWYTHAAPGKHLQLYICSSKKICSLRQKSHAYYAYTAANTSHLSYKYTECMLQICSKWQTLVMFRRRYIFTNVTVTCLLHKLNVSSIFLTVSTSAKKNHAKNVWHTANFTYAAQAINLQHVQRLSFKP